MSREYSAEEAFIRVWPKGQNMSDPTTKKTYFQYQKDLGLPIYITVDLSSFDPSFQEFLSKMKFIKLSDKEEKEVHGVIGKNNLARILNISEATPVLAKQIQSSMERLALDGPSPHLMVDSHPSDQEVVCLYIQGSL